jgi:hypothetical protein
MVDLVALVATRTHLVTRVGPAALVDLDLVDQAARVVATPVVLADPAARAVPVDLVVPADPVTTQAVLVDLVAPADRVTTQAVLADLVAPADRVTTQAAPVAQAVPVVPANAVVPIPTRADPGTATRSVATSAGLRGATVRDRGGLALRRDPTGGAGRFLRLVGNGVMARSTTGAIRKPPFGTPVSTHGASGSSESGSRCKEQ